MENEEIKPAQSLISQDLEHVIVQLRTVKTREEARYRLTQIQVLCGAAIESIDRGIMQGRL